MNTNAYDMLRETDRMWSASAPNLDEFMSFVADDIVWLFCGSPPMRSKRVIRTFYNPIFSKPDFSLSWVPDQIEVSDAGDMGYAIGLWKTQSRDSSGTLVETTGKYATVWRRIDSDWKVVVEADYD